MSEACPRHHPAPRVTTATSRHARGSSRVSRPRSSADQVDARTSQRRRPELRRLNAARRETIILQPYVYYQIRVRRPKTFIYFFRWSRTRFYCVLYCMLQSLSEHIWSMASVYHRGARCPPRRRLLYNYPPGSRPSGYLVCVVRRRSRSTPCFTTSSSSSSTYSRAPMRESRFCLSTCTASIARLCGS